MATPIDRLREHVGERTYRALICSAYYGGPDLSTVEQVAEASDDDLLDVRNFGSKGLVATRRAVRDVLGAPRSAEDVVRDLRAWLATYPPMPDVVEGFDPEASIVVHLRRMVGNVGRATDVPTVERVRELLGDES